MTSHRSLTSSAHPFSSLWCIYGADINNVAVIVTTEEEGAYLFSSGKIISNAAFQTAQQKYQQTQTAFVQWVKCTAAVFTGREKKLMCDAEMEKMLRGESRRGRWEIVFRNKDSSASEIL